MCQNVCFDLQGRVEYALAQWAMPEEGYLMQYTGIKDSEGIDIYEGDILSEWRVSHSFPEGRAIQRIVEWREDMTLGDSYGETAVGFNMFGEQLKVIGNIHQNPELLTN